MSEVEGPGDHDLRAGLWSTGRGLSSRPTVRDPATSTTNHLVQFYEDDEFLAAAVAKFFAEGVSTDDLFLVVATEAHRQAIQRRLGDAGFDVAQALASGRLTMLDARESLAKFMRDGVPDAALFEREIGSLVNQRASRGARLRVYGEMVDVLWREGQRNAAIGLEELWNDLQCRHAFTLLCAYAMASFYKEPVALQRVCAVHTHVIDEPTVDGHAYEGPGTMLPPQYARRLDKEIEQRAEVEQALRSSLRELRHEISERRKIEEELRQSERELQLITDAVPVLVAYVGADQRYKFASASYERWFGHPVAEIRGKHIEEVLGVEAYRAVRPYMERALAGEAVTYEAELPYRDAGPRHIEATYVPQRAPDGSVAGFVGLVSDITERKNHELFRAAAAERAERLLKITAGIADAVSTAQVFEAVVDQVAEVIGASSAGLWLVEQDGRSARLVRAIGYDARAEEQLATLPLGSTATVPAIDAICRGQPIWLSSQAELVRAYPHLASLVTPGRSYRVCSLPLIAHGRTLGALALTMEDTRHAANGDERDFLLLVARYASQALERLRLFEAERRSRANADQAAERAEQLYRFAQVVVMAERLEQVFEAALDAIESTLGTKRAAILVFDDEGVMRFRAWRRLSDDYRRAVEGHSPWPRDALAPKPVLVVDVERDDALASYLPLLRREGIGSLAFVPLVTRAKLIGKFMVYYGEAHAYTAQDLELAGAIANHLASVIARFAAIAKLEETIRQNELFAGVLAHDLRNPLGAIITAAQLVLMRQEGEGDKNAKPLARIMTAGQRMTRMIDQLLDFTRARAGGGIELQLREADLAEICAQAVGELELAYSEWKIQTSVHGDSNGSWDADRLTQIISNLVANAGQHGDAEGGIRVAVDGRPADQVCLEVHNKGTIPEPLLPTLFDPFRRTRQRHDQSRGLGLGLFIVRELARAHGGTVDVTSSEDAGTTFTVRLPRHAQSGSHARAGAQRGS